MQNWEQPSDVLSFLESLHQIESGKTLAGYEPFAQLHSDPSQMLGFDLNNSIDKLMNERPAASVQIKLAIISLGITYISWIPAGLEPMSISTLRNILVKADSVRARQIAASCLNIIERLQTGWSDIGSNDYVDREGIRFYQSLRENEADQSLKDVIQMTINGQQLSNFSLEDRSLVQSKSCKDLLGN